MATSRMVGFGLSLYVAAVLLHAHQADGSPGPSGEDETVAHSRQKRARILLGKKDDPSLDVNDRGDSLPLLSASSDLNSLDDEAFLRESRLFKLGRRSQGGPLEAAYMSAPRGDMYNREARLFKLGRRTDPAFALGPDVSADEADFDDVEKRRRKFNFGRRSAGSVGQQEWGTDVEKRPFGGGVFSSSRGASRVLNQPTYIDWSAPVKRGRVVLLGKRMQKRSVADNNVQSVLRDLEE